MAKARIVYQVDDSQLDALRKELNEIKKQNKEVEEGFKGSNEELKKTGGVLGDLKGAVAGLGLAAVATAAIAEFAKLTQEIIKNRKEVAQLTGQTGKGLDLITAKLKATSQVFDKDFNEILQAANVLSKEFGVTLTEAIDEVNEGFTRGLDINGEYLHTLREYSTFIKEAGLNTRQFNVLIQRQVQQGIFSDKGIDAIKEAVISIREMTPATRDAIRSIGIDTDQLIGDIRSGATTYFEAVQQIATKTRELADPQKTGVILADVFRGAGEDAGNFVFTLDEVGNSFADVNEEQQKYIDGQTRLLEATEKTDLELIKFSANIQGLGTSLETFWEQAKAATIGALNDIISAFISSEQEVENFKKSISGTGKDTLITVIDELNKQIEENEVKMGNLEITYGKSSAKVIGTKDKIKQLKEELEIATGQLADLEEAERKEKEEQEKLNQQKIEATELTQKLVEEKEKEVKAAKELEDKLNKEAEARKQSNEELQKENFLYDQRNKVREAAKKGGVGEDDVESFVDGVDQRIRKIDEENEAKEAAFNIDQERIQARKELASEAIGGLVDIYSSFAQLRIAQITQEIDSLELARNRELELAQGNKEKEAEINKKFDRQVAELRQKQVNKQKEAAIFETIINTAAAIAKALPNIPLSILAGALGAAQIAFIAAQPVPKFAKGTLDVPGSGTGDTVHAMLTPHEAVIPVQETKDYYPALKAIYTRSIDPEIINNIAKNGGSQPNITVNDYDKLAKAVMNQPQFNISMNESGFSYHMYRQNKSLHLKQNKFKFNN